MNTRIVSLFALVLFAVAGCSTTKVADTKSKHGDLMVPDFDSVEVDDLRDAMLALRRVHFAHNSSVLPQESRNALREAAEKLRHYPDVEVFVVGHADERGENEFNIALGERRSRMTASYLEKLGVANERLVLLSYGEERPISNQRDSLGYAINRRVEFKLRKGKVMVLTQDGELIDDDGRSLRAPTTFHSDPFGG